MLLSRSYLVLVGALVGVIGLAGTARVLEGGDGQQLVVADVAALDGPEGGAPATAETDEVAPGADATVTGDADPDDLADRVRAELGLDPVVDVDPDCLMSVRLELDVRHRDVACLESQLVDAGVLVGAAPDDVFDASTEAAVRSFQDQSGLVVDGVVGPQTAAELGAWSGPNVLPPDPSTCPPLGRSAVVDRYNQRAWLCEFGDITEVVPVTTALSQPDPGDYEVYAKELNASSDISGDESQMTHFVAFTYGKYQGARIAFHSVPTYQNGGYVQPLDSVGAAELQGESAGCIRLLPADARLIWRWLDVGDTVSVVT